MQRRGSRDTGLGTARMEGCVFLRRSSRFPPLSCNSDSGQRGRNVCSRQRKPIPRRKGSRGKAGRNRLPSFQRAERFRIWGTFPKSRRRISMNQLTCSSAGSHASLTLSPGLEKVSPTRADTLPLNLSNWLIAQGYDGRWSKTSLVFCPAGPEKILPASYRCCAGGKSKSPKEAGASVESSCLHRDALEWHGASLTLNIPEFPNFHGRSRNEGDVSSLSDILVRGSIPQRYYLTARCAEGILRRAERRGKTLPPVLKAALERQAKPSKQSGGMEAIRPEP